MASTSQVRPPSPNNSVKRTCIAKNSASDSVLLNCVLFNYLQHDFDPNPGRNVGFFESQSWLDLELFSHSIKYSAVAPLVRHRSIFSRGDVVSVTIRITARKYDEGSTNPNVAISDDRYYLEATASAFGSGPNFIVRSHPLRVILENPQDLQQKQEWDQLQFGGALKLLRWFSKVKYDSCGESRIVSEVDNVDKALGMYTKWNVNLGLGAF